MLKSYPVKSLKEHFELTGLKQEDLISDVINSESESDILNFATVNFGFLHQHVYVFSINNSIPSTLNLAGGNIFSDTTTNGVREIFLTIDTAYTFFNPHSGQQEELVFRCPVMIRATTSQVILSINILERNVNNYFQHRVFMTGKDIEDNDIIERLNTAFGSSVTITNIDLTDGIKYLWEDDFIDAAFVKFKKSVSTTTESMDEENTLKEHMPDVYAQITGAPLDKNVFRIKRDVVSFMPTFAIEPRKGKLAFTRFPNRVESIQNLVDLILTNNR
ncbi:hypothetical protein [Gaetbulibacter sp. S0825]|uniref:hypothetical protein n=1 Tax=Gaetbulibacter sp. S0825 TaxID=2720084 RepID=UPI00142F6380|nr:hypothetical protein [Gaetbulibacter sp. S0825]